MSKLKRGYQAGVGNIKPEEVYDPFPKTGLVKQYEPFIRDWVGDFCKRFPNVRHDDALFEAIQMALEFEPGFDPTKAKDFSTPLRHHLKGLQRRLHDREWKEQEQHRLRLKSGTVEDISDQVLPESVRVPESPYKEDASDEGEPVSPSRDLRSLNQLGGFKPLTIDAEIAHALAMQKDAAESDRRIAEEALPTEALEYGTGGNATPVAFDMKGAIIGLRLYDNAEPHVMGVMDRLSRDLRTLLGFEPPLPRSRLTGAMRAVVADGERKQREADQEAENQRNGDYGPVFLEVRAELRPSIKFREPKKRVAPRLDVQKPTPVSEAPNLSRLDPFLREVHHADRVALLVGAAEALRPSLDDKERAVLDWLLNPGRRNLTALAKEIDITKGYASKLRGRVIDLLRKQMTVTPEERTKLIYRGSEILMNKDMAYLLHKGGGSITWPWRK